MPIEKMEYEIVNRLGLHARAAAQLVQTANRFLSDVMIEKDGNQVNGKSIMGVMMLAASKGSSIILHAEGEDANQCIQKLETLIKNRFDESE